MQEHVSLGYEVQGPGQLEVERSLNFSGGKKVEQRGAEAEKLQRVGGRLLWNFLTELGCGKGERSFPLSLYVGPSRPGSGRVVCTGGEVSPPASSSLLPPERPSARWKHPSQHHGAGRRREHKDRPAWGPRQRYRHLPAHPACWVPTDGPGEKGSLRGASGGPFLLIPPFYQPRRKVSTAEQKGWSGTPEGIVWLGR